MSATSATECWLVSRVVAELQNQHASRQPVQQRHLHGARRGAALLRASAPSRWTEGRFLEEAEESRSAARLQCSATTCASSCSANAPVGPGDPSPQWPALPDHRPDARQDQNSSYNGLDSDKIFIPYSTMVRDLPPKDPNFHPGDRQRSDLRAGLARRCARTRAPQVLRVLGRNHHFDPDDPGAVFIWDTVENAQLVDSIFTSMTVFLGAIAVVTLTLGGVGVMNIMLVSVTERTREIGLRKAVGATRRRILVDFLVEGVLLAVLSGLGGWAGAYGLAAAVNRLPKPEMFGGLPVNGATTALGLRRAGGDRGRLGAVAGLACRRPHPGGGAAL